MPCISAVGNINPVSTMMMRPSYSTTVMFLPRLAQFQFSR